jgi:hypothetical protein
MAKNFDVTWLPQHDAVGPREVDHHKGERFGVVVACVSKGDMQINFPEGDGLLARGHSVEWVRVIFELVLGQP